MQVGNQTYMRAAAALKHASPINPDSSRSRKEESYAVPRELRLHAWLSLVPQRLSGLRSVATWSVRVWLQA